MELPRRSRCGLSVSQGPGLRAPKAEEAQPSPRVPAVRAVVSGSQADTSSSPAPIPPVTWGHPWTGEGEGMGSTSVMLMRYIAPSLFLCPWEARPESAGGQGAGNRVPETGIRVSGRGLRPSARRISVSVPLTHQDIRKSSLRTSPAPPAGGRALPPSILWVGPQHHLLSSQGPGNDFLVFSKVSHPLMHNLSAPSYWMRGPQGRREGEGDPLETKAGVAEGECYARP